MKAIVLPSGENSGERSLAGCVVSADAVPPVEGTRHRSPRQAKTRTLPSGESAGSDANRTGSLASAVKAEVATTERTRIARSMENSQGSGKQPGLGGIAGVRKTPRLHASL